jgi:hypothetical protein
MDLQSECLQAGYGPTRTPPGTAEILVSCVNYYIAWEMGTGPLSDRRQAVSLSPRGWEVRERCSVVRTGAHEREDTNLQSMSIVERASTFTSAVVPDRDMHTNQFPSPTSSR